MARTAREHRGEVARAGGVSMAKKPMLLEGEVDAVEGWNRKRRDIHFTPQRDAREGVLKFLREQEASASAFVLLLPQPFATLSQGARGRLRAAAAALEAAAREEYRVAREVEAAVARGVILQKCNHCGDALETLEKNDEADQHVHLRDNPECARAGAGFSVLKQEQR